MEKTTIEPQHYKGNYRIIFFISKNKIEIISIYVVKMTIPNSKKQLLIRHKEKNATEK